MAKRITDEERIENFFLTASEQSAVDMAEKIRLILRIRWGGNPRAGSLLPKQSVGRPRKQRAGGPIDVKMKEPEIPRVDSPSSGKS